MDKAKGGAKESLKVYIGLFISFFKIGALTFGGGYAMLPMLEHEVVWKHKWMDRQEVLDYFAVSQTLPGIIAVNAASFCGSKRKGLPGALVAAIGVIAPSIIVISLIAAFISNFSEIEAVQRVLRGMNVAVAALLTEAVVKMSKGVLADAPTVVLAIISFAAVAIFNISSVIILFFAVAVGIIQAKRKGKLK